MEDFKHRREVILEQFEKAKSDLETLNTDIDEQIGKNQEEISKLMSCNDELSQLRIHNSNSIKTFIKLLK